MAPAAPMPDDLTIEMGGLSLDQSAGPSRPMERHKSKSSRAPQQHHHHQHQREISAMQQQQQVLDEPDWGTVRLELHKLPSRQNSVAMYSFVDAASTDQQHQLPPLEPQAKPFTFTVRSCQLSQIVSPQSQ